MALGGLKKTVSGNNQVSAEEFISGAKQRVTELAPTQQKYKRLTFSLNEQTDRQIDELLVNSQLARANRSVIVKAAIQQLASLSPEELKRIVAEQLD